MARDLEALASDEAGRDWLQAHRLFTDVDDFLDALAPPQQAQPLAAQLASGDDAWRPVFSGHQLSCDYRWSVVSKVQCLLALDPARATAVLAWLDTDRCGSDRLSTSFGWPPPAPDCPGVNLLSNSERQAETRYATPRGEMLEAAARRFADVVHGSNASGRADVDSQRLGALLSLLRSNDSRSLADLNLELTNLQFAGERFAATPALRVSELMCGGAARLGMARTLARADAVVAQFNAALDTLRREGIECPVQPRADDYLPLFWSCPLDARRNPVHQRKRNGTRSAVANCRCGEQLEVCLVKQISGH